MKVAIFTVLGLATAALAQAAPPAAPVISVGATDIRQLQFDWDPVSTTTRYELWSRANDSSPWTLSATSPGQHPQFRLEVSVHLLDFRSAQYYVNACNTSGCSSSNTVGVQDLAIPAMGYFKPQQDGNLKYFGGRLEFAADGKTFAVLDAETLDGAVNSGVVHVYHKTTATSGWRREARLVPPVWQSNTGKWQQGHPV